MKYYVVIPAHNESDFVALTLRSLIDQSVLPSKVVVVNDHSTDNTAQIVSTFVDKYPFIQLIHVTSEASHLPGSKVIRAFYKGFEVLDNDYDVMVKLDADLILPSNYFETILNHFKNDPQIGMAGGFASIEKNGEWIIENLTNKDHIRGAFKAYRKSCFEEIGKLKIAMGWDTVDELLCHFYGWKIKTDQSLVVKHLKPTGANYNKEARYKQGAAFYSLGYGFWITLISSAKLAFMKNKPLLFIDYINGFWKAKKENKPWLVTKEQAAFFRKFRWRKMKEKLF